MSDIFVYSDQNGERFIGDMTTAQQNGFKAGAIKPSKLIIPYSIEEIPIKAIGTCAFYHCQDIKECVIKAKIHTIYNNAFQGCLNLISINIPSSVLLIKDSAIDGRKINIYSTKSMNVYFEPHSKLKHIENAGFSNFFAMNLFIYDRINPTNSTYLFGLVKNLTIYSRYSYLFCGYQTTVSPIMLQMCKTIDRKKRVLDNYLMLIHSLLTSI